MKSGAIILFIFTLAACGRLQSERDHNALYPYSEMLEVPFTEVKIKDIFWSAKIDSIQKNTLPLLLDLAEEEGRVDNFRIVAGMHNAKIRLHIASDSDIYKLIEAASYVLARKKDPELAIRVDSLIELIEAAQLGDGYLNTQFTLPFDHPASPDPSDSFVVQFGFGPADRWQPEPDQRPFAFDNLYCAGHLMQAAAAHFRATGSNKLLNVAGKVADHIGHIIDQKRISVYAVHPQVVVGLMRLYETTGTIKYLHLAELLTQDVGLSRPGDVKREEIDTFQQNQDLGLKHNMWTAAIPSGVTDVVRATGKVDLKAELNALWDDITFCKMYIHGGTGNDNPGSPPGIECDLAIETTGSHSCASIEQGQWSHRLNLLSGEARFADLMELEVYNSALAGISNDGLSFLYSNKLNIGTQFREGPYSGIRTSYLSCCPSKLPVFVAGIGSWIYAKDAQTLFVNMYIGSEVVTEIGDQGVFSMAQHTQYPWVGISEFIVLEAPESKIRIGLRMPGWFRNENLIPNGPYYFEGEVNSRFSVMLNGNATPASIDPSGYVYVSRKWRTGDVIQLNFDMPVRKVATDEKVVANTGRVALSRGPLLYCLEGADHHFDLEKMTLSTNDALTTLWDTTVFGGIMALEGKGIVQGRTVNFTAIPYFLWQNRGVGPLVTLVPVLRN